MVNITELLPAAGISVFASGIIIYLARDWMSERLKGAIKSEYDAKLETLKAQLKSQNDSQLEQFKAQLQIAANDRSIRMTRVFERTVDTVAGTYEHLLAFHDAVGHYTSVVEWQTDPSKEERRKIVAEKFGEFLRYYRPKKPFLPKRTVMSIDHLRDRLHKTTLDFMWGVEKDGDARRIRRGEDKDTWSETHKFMTEEVPGILGLLEDDLRKILGINEE